MRRGERGQRGITKEKKNEHGYGGAFNGQTLKLIERPYRTEGEDFREKASGRG